MEKRSIRYKQLHPKCQHLHYIGERPGLQLSGLMPSAFPHPYEQMALDPGGRKKFMEAWVPPSFIAPMGNHRNGKWNKQDKYDKQFAWGSHILSAEFAPAETSHCVCSLHKANCLKNFFGSWFTAPGRYWPENHRWAEALMLLQALMWRGLHAVFEDKKVLPLENFV